MPNLPRIKSNHRRLVVLLAFTFLVGTMITIVNYNQNITQQRFVLSDNDRTALLNYFKYTHLKRNLISENQVSNLNKNNHLETPSSSSSNLNNPLLPAALSSIKFNSPDQQSNNNLVKLSSTTFSSDRKESSTKFLINRDNRDVNNKDFSSSSSSDQSNSHLNNQLKNQQNNQVLKDNQQSPSSNNDQVDKSINSSKKPITPVPSFQQDKMANLTSSNEQLSISKQLQQKLNKKQIVEVKPLPPVFVHSEAELNLTQKFVMGKKNFCSKEHGYGLDLLAMVISSPANFEARNAIRKTWGGFAVERGSKLLFVLGRSSKPEINEKLRQEDNQHEDILQGQFQDAYYNLTLKSLAIVNWVADNCEKAKYVLKIDDDMFVNMQLLVDFAETREFKNVIIGKIAKKWLPHRDSNSKWYVPTSAYSGQVYPNFATGPAYLIHRDAIPNLVKVIRSNSTKVIKLEDVFLAGIVAEKAGVRRLNYSLFKNAYFEVNKCNFMRFITSHQHSPKEIIRLWQLVYSDKKMDCNIKKATSTKAPSITKKEQPKSAAVQQKSKESPIEIKLKKKNEKN